MKSRTLCACVSAMLLVSTVAFGEIIFTSELVYEDVWPLGGLSGGTAQHTATGWDVGDDGYGAGLAYGEGWELTYTTESGYFNWYIYLYAWAEAELFLWGDPELYGCAYAIAKAKGHVDNWYTEVSFTCEARVYNDDEPLFEIDGADTDYDSGTYDVFSAYDEIYCYHLACAVATTQGEDNIGFSHACARAWGNLSESE